MDSVTNSCEAEAPIDRRRLARAVLATVGHELRTPLTSIRGYIETLLEGEFDAPTARRFLETARRETLRLGRLVDGMLEFSMLDLSATASQAICNVVEQIRATVDLVAPMAAARRITIVCNVPPSAPARVDGDACVHALANLVENAVKYGRAGGTVHVSCHRGKHFVAIAVEDDGCGVAPGARETIFELGVRGDSSELPGNGIGLAVVKAIAERACGDVRVEPSSLGGARFVLRFPAG
jgi:two-component system, OmpR family, phosphate regulon sensor histidine kinase PhoR